MRAGDQFSSALEPTGAALGILGALLIATNTSVSHLGWVPFVMSSLMLTVFYKTKGHRYLLVMSLVYTGINCLGLYRWVLAPTPVGMP